MHRQYAVVHSSMLHATSRDSCTRTALQSPQPHDPPAFWPVLRHARDDASCTTASRELGVPTFNAWLMRRLILAPHRRPEITCNVVTAGPLSAGILGRFEELAQLFCTCSAAASRRSESCSNAPCYPLPPAFCSLTFELSAPKYLSRWFDDG
jgi:hypothetical protein